MNLQLKTALYAILIAVACFFVIETAPAQEVSNGTTTNSANSAYSILILSKSNINELTTGKFLKQYRNIDAALMNKIQLNLQTHGLASGPVASEEDLKIRDYHQLLAYKLENVEFGFRNPFGRHTNVKVSYSFQKKQGGVIISGEYMEHSNKGWKNCVRTISARISSDVANAIAGKYMPSAKLDGDAKEPQEQDNKDKSIEERLQKLDDLKAKGLVTQEEYTRKKEEILTDL